MNENKDKDRQDKAPKTVAGASADKPVGLRVSQAKQTGWKKFLSKKWAFPATYVAAAAIILALMWVIQDSRKEESTVNLTPDISQNEMEDASPTTAPPTAQGEEMQWPVNRVEVEVSMPFYEADASYEDKESALVESGNKFTPNTGIALQRKDNKPFDVLAAMSGKVTRVDNVASIGKLIEITHDDGLKTVYYSLSDVTVTKGDIVKQGDVIAKAGRSEIEKDLDVHLHFEVLKDGEPINPENYIAQR